MIPPEPLYLSGVNDVQLAATSFGEGEQTVLLLHGAGQTRHSWRHAGEVIGQHKWRAVTLDTRGHGDSDWSSSGDYSIDTLIGDLKSVAQHYTALDQRKPILVGASLGGITGLLAEGESDPQIFESLVLVDITPRIDQTGVERIIGFMNRYQTGFASLEEAVDAVANYQSHNRRHTSDSYGRESDHDSGDGESNPKEPGRGSAGNRDAIGLKKNLRIAKDGRYYWHWDPRLMQHIGAIDDSFYLRQRDAASCLKLPVLLIRGQQSEIVSVESANELLELVPHARYVDIADAAHMVAGDNNDVFVDAVLEFIGG